MEGRARPAPSDGRELTLGGLGRDGRGGPLLAPPAALVAVALDLAAELVGDEVDRVVELTGGVLGPQRDALEVQRRLGHLALGVGRIALLEDLDLEDRQLAHLLGDLVEAAGDVLAQLVGDRKVAPLDLDLHGTPLVRRMSPRRPDGTGPHHRVLAYVTAATSSAPPALSACAQASRVEPVVWTSSTSSRRAGGAATSAASKRPARRRATRPAPPWRAPRSARRRPGARGSPERPASAAASSAAGSYPRRRRRPRWAGTGTTARGGARRSAGRLAAMCAAISPATDSAARNLSARTSSRAVPS